MPDWHSRGGRNIWLPYTQMKTAPAPLMVRETRGSTLILEDGRELIDGIASWWTACHGYNHPHIAAAVTEQLARMPHVMFGGLNHEPALTLAQRLCGLLPPPLERVFFSDSGSVAVEVALKMAVQTWLNRGIAGRHKFVSFRNGYHGDTMATMALCDPDEGMHSHFKGWLPEEFIIPLPDTAERQRDFEDLLKRKKDSIAAVIVEPLVQGAGGMKFHAPEVLAAIANITQAQGHFLILDEVMTGFGRTGTLFACQQTGIVPDIICLSKALTGGTIPLAATVASREIFESFWDEAPEKALMHGPTYMANPLACAAANASLDLFEREPRLEQVAALETALRTGLEACRNLPGVIDVRVKGAIGVVELSDLKDTKWLRAQFIERGVWIRPFSNIVYVTPAFTIGQQELNRLIAAIVEVISTWAESLA